MPESFISDCVQFMSRLVALFDAQKGHLQFIGFLGHYFTLQGGQLCHSNWASLLFICLIYISPSRQQRNTVQLCTNQGVTWCRRWSIYIPSPITSSSCYTLAHPVSVCPFAKYVFSNATITTTIYHGSSHHV